MPAEFAVLGVASIGSLLFYWQLVRKLAFDGAGRSQYFKDSDAAFALVLGGLFVYLIAGSAGATQKEVINTRFIILNCFIYFCIVMTIVSFLIIRDVDPRKVFGLWWRQGWKGVGAVLAALVVILPFIYLVQKVTALFFDAQNQPQEVFRYFLTHTALNERLPLVFMAVVVAPISEEIIFRGYLFGVARKYVGFWPAALVVSLLFAAFHLHLPALPGLFLLAMAFTLIYERAGSLWAPILMHAAFNSCSLIISIYWPNL